MIVYRPGEEKGPEEGKREVGKEGWGQLQGGDVHCGAERYCRRGRSIFAPL